MFKIYQRHLNWYQSKAVSCDILLSFHCNSRSIFCFSEIWRFTGQISAFFRFSFETLTHGVPCERSVIWKLASNKLEPLCYDGENYMILQLLCFFPCNCNPCRYAMSVRSFVRPSVCLLSVMFVYCIETIKRILTRRWTTPFVAAEGHAETQRICVSSRDSRIVVNKLVWWKYVDNKRRLHLYQSMAEENRTERERK